MNVGSKSARHPFFVYGTLLPGQPNFHLWGTSIVAQETAVFHKGRLYDMGHYPMLVEAPGGRVHGRLMVVAEALYPLLVERLDALEGYDPRAPQASAYRRRAREVLVNGRRVVAWVYLGQRRHTDGYAPIAGGDWAAYAARKRRQLAQWWANVPSVRGLHDTKKD